MWTIRAYARREQACARALKLADERRTRMLVEHDQWKDPYGYRVMELGADEQAPDLGARVNGVTVLDVFYPAARVRRLPRARTPRREAA